MGHGGKGSERMFGLKLRELMGPIALIALILLVWEGIVEYFSISKILLPKPSLIFSNLIDRVGILPRHTWVTAIESLSGFGIGACIGVLLAIGIASSRVLEKSFYPILIALQSTPKIAFAPLFIIWLGFGLLPKIVMSALMVIFPVTINTATGLMEIEPGLLDLAKLNKATRWRIFKKIRFPSSGPYMFAGFKIGTTMALVGAIVGEYLGASAGLGYLSQTAISYYDTPLLFMSFIPMIILGVTYFGAVCVIEKKALPWRVRGKR